VQKEYTGSWEIPPLASSKCSALVRIGKVRSVQRG